MAIASAEMGDRLLEGGAAQGLVAGLAPPFDGEFVEAGLGEMMGDDFRFGRRALRLIAQDFGRASMQRLAATLEQAVVGGVLDQRVLEAISRRMARALGDEEVRFGQPVERGLQGSESSTPRPRAAARRRNRGPGQRRSARLRALRQAGRAARRATVAASAGWPASRRPRLARAEDASPPRRNSGTPPVRSLTPSPPPCSAHGGRRSRRPSARRRHGRGGSAR